MFFTKGLKKNLDKCVFKWEHDGNHCPRVLGPGLFFTIFFYSTFVVFRCIKPQLKSFALGIYTLAIRVLGKYYLCFNYDSHDKCIFQYLSKYFYRIIVHNYNNIGGQVHIFFSSFLSSFLYSLPLIPDFFHPLFWKYFFRASA